MYATGTNSSDASSEINFPGDEPGTGGTMSGFFTSFKDDENSGFRGFRRAGQNSAATGIEEC